MTVMEDDIPERPIVHLGNAVHTDKEAVDR